MLAGDGHVTDIHNPEHQRVGFVTASADDTAIVWDMKRGKMISRLKGHGQDVVAVDFHRTASDRSRPARLYRSPSEDRSGMGEGDRRGDSCLRLDYCHRLG